MPSSKFVAGLLHELLFKLDKFLQCLHIGRGGRNVGLFDKHNGLPGLPIRLEFLRLGTLLGHVLARGGNLGHLRFFALGQTHAFE